MIEVTAAIISKGSKILIARRSPHKHLGGFWELPGGKIEFGETPQECLRRELIEELGMNVKVGALYMENLCQYPEKTILLKAYLCELISEDLVLTAHDKTEWIDVADYPNYQFAPADVPIIESLLNYNFNDYA